MKKAGGAAAVAAEGMVLGRVILEGGAARCCQALQMRRHLHFGVAALLQSPQREGDRPE